MSKEQTENLSFEQLKINELKYLLDAYKKDNRTLLDHLKDYIKSLENEPKLIVNYGLKIV